jgi:arsenate reductase (glutaredoxin)
MLTVYGIKTCDTCRKALKWLTAEGHEHTWVDLRKTPPAAERVADWVDALGSKPLRNTSGGSYRALPADKKTWTEDQWKTAFAADPMLLKRPVLEKDGVAVTTGFKGWEPWV